MFVLWKEAVAYDKPSARSRGFWTASEFDDCNDDDCEDDNMCLLLLMLLLLCKLSPPLLGAERILCRFLLCTMGVS